MLSLDYLSRLIVSKNIVAPQRDTRKDDSRLMDGCLFGIGGKMVMTDAMLKLSMFMYQKHWDSFVEKVWHFVVFLDGWEGQSAGTQE